MEDIQWPGRQLTEADTHSLGEPIQNLAAGAGGVGRAGGDGKGGLHGGQGHPESSTERGGEWTGCSLGEELVSLSWPWPG